MENHSITQTRVSRSWRKKTNYLGHVLLVNWSSEFFVWSTMTTTNAFPDNVVRIRSPTVDRRLRPWSLFDISLSVDWHSRQRCRYSLAWRHCHCLLLLLLCWTRYLSSTCHWSPNDSDLAERTRKRKQNRWWPAGATGDVQRESCAHLIREREREKEMSRSESEKSLCSNDPIAWHSCGPLSSMRRWVNEWDQFSSFLSLLFFLLSLGREGENID